MTPDGQIPRPRTSVGRGGHALLALGLFDHAEEDLLGYAGWAARNFTAVQVVLVDLPAVHTYRAVGYKTHRALHKARSEGKRLQTRARRALAVLGLPGSLVVSWAELAARYRYQVLYDQVRHAYESSPAFRAACLRATATMLADRVPGALCSRGQVQIAAHSLLAELPLALDGAGILGVPESTRCQPSPLELTELLAAAPPELCPRPGQLALTLHSAPAQRPDPVPGSPLPETARPR
ncbi:MULTISPECIES: tRNA-dependent cyclodipeptide synthase [unclassified Crossiella]|uniref:tRNA-dependent cyclodipeptide synthase n=1 Tax=unclassified Crossiella TaxID=2620835 RepID=UPI001FFF6A9B|nr:MULTISPECIES: tRNA-dependent cyclodipeptide synthase [unclassified Crossiella]MCK2243929.1 tRNA-dependent cyclodipeptide synthase [Crossiella sp. S99.2]MCK2257213.1 tRNA-dependent cyclodipeptide synthase [Crossiella sp. S99.1]